MRTVRVVDLRPVVTCHFGVSRPSNNNGYAYASRLTEIVRNGRISSSHGTDR